MDLHGRRVALALGGGGARGCAHIGAIAELEERGAEIVAIAGTSMGAVIGGLYAADQLDGYRDWLYTLSHRDVLRLLDPSLRSPGLIGAEKIMARIRDFIPGVQIEDLRIPFTAVAAELLSGKEVWFQSGPLDRAIRASIAIPSIITPLVFEGRVLVDGGILDLVPVMPLAASKADLLVAVSLIGNPHRAVNMTLGLPLTLVDEPLTEDREQAMQQRDQDILRRVMARLGWDVGDVAEEAEPVVAVYEPPTLRTTDVMELSVQTMQRMITRFQLSSFPPDIVIELPSDICGTVEFHRAREMSELGRARARAVLDSMAG